MPCLNTSTRVAPDGVDTSSVLSEVISTVAKPEAVYFRTRDGYTHKIHPEFVQFFQSFLSKNVRMGSSPTNPISVPERVDGTSLKLILLYFEGRSAQPKEAMSAFGKYFCHKISESKPQRLAKLCSASKQLEITELSEFYEWHSSECDRRFMAELDDLLKSDSGKGITRGKLRRKLEERRLVGSNVKVYAADRQQVDVEELARQIQSGSASAHREKKKRNTKKNISKAAGSELPDDDVSGLGLKQS